MQNFRPNDKNWVIKEHDLNSSSGDVEPGDLIMITSGGVTVDLATSGATAIVGISAEELSSNTTTYQTIRVLEPTSPLAEMIGPVTAGAIAAGLTDSGRSCEVEGHDGVDTDTTGDNHLTIVKGTVATTDGSSTEGEGVFRIAQTLDKLNAF